MNYATHKISLDIHKPESQVVLDMKRGDTGRKIIISLTEDGRPYSLTADCSAVFKAKKPDGHNIYCDCDIKSNVIVYNVSAQTTTSLGEVECEVMLYNEIGVLITSPRFMIIVNDTVHSQGSIVEPDSEASAKLKEMMNNIVKLAVEEYSRPTAQLEVFMDEETDFNIWFDTYGQFGRVFMVDFASRIPVGTEISSIEIAFPDENNGEYINIKDLYTLETSPYIILSDKVFYNPDYECLTYAYLLCFSPEFTPLLTKAIDYGWSKIRITYYTN